MHGNGVIYQNDLRFRDDIRKLKKTGGVDHSRHEAHGNIYKSNNRHRHCQSNIHYSDVIIGTISSQITNLTIVYSTVYSDADQRKHQSSASLAFVRGTHGGGGAVNSPHKWPVKRKMLPFDDVIMSIYTSGLKTCKAARLTMSCGDNSLLVVLQIVTHSKKRTVHHTCSSSQRSHQE